jgi:N-acetylmuramoyl-L-alanine amidase
MTRIAISSGHGLKIRGAAGPPPWGIDEVDEARRVVERVAEIWRGMGIGVMIFHDDVSTTQSENLDRIISWHNSQERDYDQSIHFNAYQVTTTKKMGTECLYVTQEDLAGEVSAAIAEASGLPDRGGKYRGDLAFLNGTEMPALLVEVVFCDAKLDCDAYRENFDIICQAIASATVGENEGEPERPERPPAEEALFYAKGTCSWFGGPEDDKVSASEGLAFIYNYDEAPHLFLPQQPEGTTGLARRLNPNIFYVACRFDYSITPKGMLANPSQQALVRAKGQEFWAWPADWGPHEEQTGRAADLSPALMMALDLSTDDEVEVIYPANA